MTPDPAAEPVFSVLIPTVRRPAFLRRALESVLSQRGPSLEIVVGDDGDGEGMAIVGHMNDPRISGFVSGHAGQVGTRNGLVQRARGAALAWLDDDDWWTDPNLLASYAGVLRRKDTAAVVSGWIVNEDANRLESGRLPFHARTDAATLRKSNMMLVSGLAYPRAFHDRFGAFDAARPYYWDWDWYLRLAGAGIAFVAAGGSGVCISARGDSVSSAAHETARRAELDALCETHGLGYLPLRNHASIARDEAEGRGAV